MRSDKDGPSCDHDLRKQKVKTAVKEKEISFKKPVDIDPPTGEKLTEKYNWMILAQAVENMLTFKLKWKPWDNCKC